MKLWALLLHCEAWIQAVIYQEAPERRMRPVCADLWMCVHSVPEYMDAGEKILLGEALMDVNKCIC